MSQAGIVDVEGSHPQIPTQFVTNMGTAIPIANTLEILGTTVAAHSIPIETTGSGNTVTIVAQYASAAASSIATNAGFASFNSADFTVDANGYVTFSGSSGTESFTVDAFTAPGTNPVLPNGSGNVTVTGGQVAAGTTTNVIRTDSLAANTYTIQIQRSQAVASTTIGDNGVSHFNSAFFTVDANGFVSLNGSAVGETITGNTGGALSPTAGNWNILGSSVVAGTTPVHTVGAGSTLTVDVQISQAIASTNATNVGLAAFNSAFFTVDANGFVSLNGSAVGETITGNVGGALSPTAGNWNIVGTSTAAGTTPVQTSGTGSTLTVQVQKSQAIASTNATNVGLAAFSSAQFVVDANGFVTLNGAAVGETITGNTGGALSPTAGNWNILGTSTASGTTPVQTAGSGSTLTVQVQKSQAIAATDASKVGLANFNSSDFSVDANGFVSAASTGYIRTITGTTGGAESPAAGGNFNLLGATATAGTTPVVVAGTANTETIKVQITQAIASTDATKIGLAAFDSSVFTVDANGFVSLSGTGDLRTLSDDVGTTITPSGGNIQLVGHVVEQGATKFSTIVAGTNLANINPMSPARWIVDSLGFNGTHTTISSAISSATSGDTILILPGTYTENPTLKAGVNLTAYDCDGLNINSSTLVSTGHVIINGKVSMTTAGYSSISGITFQTNSDYCLSITGSAASNIFLTECTIVGSNHNPIQFTSSSSSSNIFIQYSNSTITNASFNLYDMTSPGSLSFYYCSNADVGVVASNNSAGVVTMEYVNGNNTMTASSTGSVALIHCDLDSTNASVLVTSGTGVSTIRFCSLVSGSASAISIGSGTTVHLNMCSIESSNTNAITGAGTLTYGGLNFTSTSSTINVTTQTGGVLNGGKFQAPSAGFIGEEIRATANGSITSTATSNLASISLTAGIWNVTGIANYVFTTSGSVTTTGLSTTSATFTGTQGDDYVNNINSFGLNSQVYSSIPGRRITLTSTTTYYLVISATFVSTATCFGRISATRVG